MKSVFIYLFAILITSAFSQQSNTIITSDIDNFWVAYDSIQKTSSHSKKLALINQLYIEKGTEGLKAFMKLRDYNDSLYVELIDKHPLFWNSIRPNTLSVKTRVAEFENSILRLREIYPELRDAVMYFTIGGLRSGGTVSENMSLVGAEIATATPSTDVSDLNNDWLKNVFAGQSLDNIVSLNIHEYIHTQQKPYRGNRLLNQTIKEGSCDFIAELAMEKPWQSKYVTYGKAHLPILKENFKADMFSNDFSDWLYNGVQKGEGADMGYFIGYEICKSYYNQAEDKIQAVKDIVELNYNDDNVVEEFLKRSKFFD